MALEKAMTLFWTNGYSGTSLTDLTTTMGINKPSLYLAFGNKEDLFRQTLDLYVQKHGRGHAVFLQEHGKSLAEKMQNYLLSIAEGTTNPNLPSGCFVCSTTCELGSIYLPPEAITLLEKINEVTKITLQEFFKEEQVKGNLPMEKSPLTVANYYLTIQFGLAVMARSGASFDELKELIKLSGSQVL
ncbi:MAG: TetR/AcrR family transcriptional regulator [Sneathiella sp.]